MKSLLDKVGAKWRMPVPGGYGKPMVDFFGCFKGNYFEIETKVGDNKPTKLQIDCLIETIKAGGSAIVAYDLQEVELMLHEIDEGRRYYSEELEPWVED